MKELKKDLSILLRGYKIIFFIDAKLIPLNIISAILEAVYPFIIIYTGAEMLNAFSSDNNTSYIYFLMILTLVLNLLTQQIKQFVGRVIYIRKETFEHKFKMFLNNKMLDMDYGSIENPETHIKRQRIEDIRILSGGGIWKLVYQSGEMATSLFTIITSVIVTYKAFILHSTLPQNGIIGFLTSPLSSVALLVLMIINTLLSIKFNAVNTIKIHKMADIFLPQNRMLGYLLMNYINSYHAGKDIRLYNQKQMIIESFGKMIINLKNHLRNQERIQTTYTNLNTMLSSITGLLVYIFIGVKALYKLIGLGDLYKYINGVTQFNSGLNGFLNSFYTIRTNNAYLEVLYGFLDMPNISHNGTLTTEKRADNEYEIEFHNVSFKYSDTDTYALKNLSLKFNIGQRMAVVGMNGSGKTTMIKLLCRLYDPTEGEITLNGINIKKYEFAEYVSIFSVVFQDFKLFSFPLGQNVAASIDYENAKAEKCLEMAGFKDRLADMPRGLETPLYKDFEEDGVEISGGEAQKLAIARALYKDAPFIVLDEPTAALDPIAEFEIYSKFNKMVGGKTAIYISHRLSSCRFCDDIAVFHEGELIQRGSHDTLIVDKSGKYYELWNAQSQYYTDNLILA